MGQFIKKKIDARVRTLIENAVQTKHRSFFVVVGDHGKDQVMYLHYMLTKAAPAAQKPSVLWCYKKELGFSSHRKKRIKQHKSMAKQGLASAGSSEDPFELFLSGTTIRFCYYKESQKILGSTYGMCVLQDFEALTPNLLARTLETVQGGGMVVLLLKSLTSLKQLFTMTMDVHARYRTEARSDVVGRFNERFLLSLGEHSQCLVVDDELNVLPISQGRHVQPLARLGTDQAPPSPLQLELKALKESVQGTEPLCSLVQQAKTLDQAKALLLFVEAISEKTLKSTVSLTAARGRGKSAALGLALGAAVSYGYANMFVTSPSPENLKTVFDFVFKALDALGYEEHLDYDIVQSTHAEFNKAIVRVNIFKHHRQTIQYIHPQDAHVLGQAELVVIDEAAAIPLPLVKKLMGPYLVLMASTINGYEGTGRSLSLKLLQQLREQSRAGSAGVNKETGDIRTTDGQAVGGRTLRECQLEEPIRYAAQDPTEKWLNKLLCLDASIARHRQQLGCPHPDQCEMFSVNRDTLFSFHPISEAFLHRMMALYVASHYKNSPNDLQLMSDAPGHQLFVLLPPMSDMKHEEQAEEAFVLPDPLVVVQVCLEGEISKESVLASLRRGKRADGDLIPWTISQQFQDEDFASLSGARVVRIAVHPDYVGMGYGSRALQLLASFYEGKIQNVMEEDEDETDKEASTVQPLPDKESVDNKITLHTETVQVRQVNRMPPLLSSLSEIKAPHLHWFGVSFGHTPQLYRFWKRQQFAPVYMRQTPNELTGEHTCIMLRVIDHELLHHCDPQWLASFAQDFRKRFIHLLAYQFRTFEPQQALSILDIRLLQNVKKSASALSIDDIRRIFSPYDLKRFESYANNMLDWHVIVDLLPTLATEFFSGRMAATLIESESTTPPVEAVVLSAVQQAILLGLGLQHKSVDDLVKELQMPASQILALFVRSMRKISDFFTQIKRQAIEGEVEAPRLDIDQENVPADIGLLMEKRDLNDTEAWEPTEQSLADEMDEAARIAHKKFKEKQKELIDSLDLNQYAIGVDDEALLSAVQPLALGKKTSKVVSVRNDASTKLKRKGGITVEQLAVEARAFEEKKHKKKKSKK